MDRDVMKRVVNYSKTNNISIGRDMSEADKQILRDKYIEFANDVLEEYITKYNQLDSNEEYVVIKLEDLGIFSRLYLEKYRSVKDEW